jgi:hypothetical protein
MDGLAALVRESLGGDPYSGVIYVFRAKRADRVKLLLWDGTGLVLVAKRLEKSSFRWPRISAAARAADVVPACPIGSSVRSTSRKAFLLHYSPTSFSRAVTADSRGLGRQEFRPSRSFLRFSKQETFSGSVSIHEFNAGSL